MQEKFFKFDAENLRGCVCAESPASSAALIYGKCVIGAFSYIGRRSEIRDATIGRYCSIASDVVIGPVNHPDNWFSSHIFAFGSRGPFAESVEFNDIKRNKKFNEKNSRTFIGNDVWIGRGATIKRGVTIGDGAIIGAGAVVVKNVLPYEVVGGVPAKNIRFRFSDEIIQRFLNLKWWNYDLSSDEFGGFDFSDVEGSLIAFESLLNEGKLKKLVPHRKEFQSNRKSRTGFHYLFRFFKRYKK